MRAIFIYLTLMVGVASCCSPAPAPKHAETDITPLTTAQDRLEDAERQILDYQGSALPYTTKALAQCELNERSGALESLCYANILAPSSVDVPFLQGVIHESLGQIEKARLYYLRSLSRYDQQYSDTCSLYFKVNRANVQLMLGLPVDFDTLLFQCDDSNRAHLTMLVDQFFRPFDREKVITMIVPKSIAESTQQ